MGTGKEELTCGSVTAAGRERAPMYAHPLYLWVISAAGRSCPATSGPNARSDRGGAPARGSLIETLPFDLELSSFYLQHLPFQLEQSPLDVLLLQLQLLLLPLKGQLPQFQLTAPHIQAAIMLLPSQFLSFLLELLNLLFQLLALALQQLSLGRLPDLFLLVPAERVVGHPNDQKRTNQTSYKTSGETLHTSLLTDGWRI
jgi:hypothetical protein